MFEEEKFDCCNMESVVKVEDEFQKNPELKSEDLKTLRKWLLDCKPNIPEIPESMLILFLHSCYYHMENTKRCIVRFYELRENSSDFFSNRDVKRPELQKALSVLRFCIFPVRDPNGYIIFHHKLKIHEPSAYVFPDGVKLLSMTVDAALHLNGTVPGVVMMFDASGVRLGHLMRVSIFALRRFFQYIQEGNPIRLKAIHVVNCNPIIDKIMVFVKPFVQKELLALLHFHYGENSTLYEYLPSSCLPSDYGGVHESIDEIHDKNSKLLEELLPYFQREEAHRKH